LVFDADGAWDRYNLRTDDGYDIYIQTSGPTQPDGRSLLRGTFEVGPGPYAWLNYVLATGVLQRSQDFGAYVIIDMWMVSLCIFPFELEVTVVVVV
jgi:feruloyl esterase